MKKVLMGDVRGEYLPLERYFYTLKEIIREWSSYPVLVDENGYVVGNVEVYNALWTIGTRFIPVARGEEELKSKVSLDELEPYYELTLQNDRIYDSVLELVARDVPTPMVKLKSLSKGGLRVWAKLEWYHPFSLSIKDRIAWYMLVNAIERGLIKSRAIYEPTSMNTGLGLVGLANYLGLKLREY